MRMAKRFNFKPERLELRLKGFAKNLSVVSGIEELRPKETYSK